MISIETGWRLTPDRIRVSAPPTEHLRRMNSTDSARTPLLPAGPMAEAGKISQPQRAEGRPVRLPIL
jgi:hypothetical protein